MVGTIDEQRVQKQSHKRCSAFHTTKQKNTDDIRRLLQGLEEKAEGRTVVQLRLVFSINNNADTSPHYKLKLEMHCEKLDVSNKQKMQP